MNLTDTSDFVFAQGWVKNNYPELYKVERYLKKTVNNGITYNKGDIKPDPKREENISKKMDLGMDLYDKGVRYFKYGKSRKSFITRSSNTALVHDIIMNEFQNGGIVPAVSYLEFLSSNNGQFTDATILFNTYIRKACESKGIIWDAEACEYCIGLFGVYFDFIGSEGGKGYGKYEILSCSAIIDAVKPSIGDIKICGEVHEIKSSNCRILAENLMHPSGFMKANKKVFDMFKDKEGYIKIDWSKDKKTGECKKVPFDYLNNSEEIRNMHPEARKVFFETYFKSHDNKSKNIYYYDTIKSWVDKIKDDVFEDYSTYLIKDKRSFDILSSIICTRMYHIQDKFDALIYAKLDKNGHINILSMNNDILTNTKKLYEIWSKDITFVNNYGTTGRGRVPQII